MMATPTGWQIQKGKTGTENITKPLQISGNEFRWVLTSKDVCQVVKNDQENHEVNRRRLRYLIGICIIQFLIKPIF
jgi:hypothetical protein